MSTPSLDISRIKLEELARQHQRLQARYDELAQQSAGMSALEQLEHLHAGLSELAFAGQPLHPQIQSMEAVLLEARSGAAAPELLAHWTQRLRQELEYGKRRAAFAHLFGSLLDEWASGAKKEPQPPGQEAFHQTYLGQLAQPPGQPPMTQLKAFFESRAEPMQAVREEVQKAADALVHPVDRDELKAHLQMLVIDPDQTPRIRALARAVKGDELQSDDHTGALTVLLNQPLEDWRWPEQVRFRSVWKRDRFRGYFEADLVTTLLLQVLGSRLAIELKQLMLQKPPLNQTSERYTSGTIDEDRLRHINGLFMPSTPASIQDLRRMGATEGVQYEGFKFTDETPDALQRLLAIVAADIDYLQRSGAAQVIAVRTDIKDFFASTPHAVALELLGALGLPETLLRFVQRTLQVPLPEGQASETAQRGLPLNLRLSYLVADGLLRVLDQLVYEQLDIRLTRFLDDIYFVTDSPEKARAAIELMKSFLSECGLELNPKKSGSVCISAQSDLFEAGLFEGPFRWGFLELDKEGRWRPHTETIDAYAAQIRAQVERSPSILARVAEYNVGVNFLIRGLAPFTRLDDAHLSLAAKALTSFSTTQFGGGQGITAELKGLIETRLELDAQQVQDGVLYWPITAGGLGLCNPQIVIASCLKRSELVPPSSPPEENARYGPWLYYYRQRLCNVLPSAPHLAPAMQGLRSEFISRGQRLLNNRNQGLTAYWEWLIQSYGPLLVEHFGAFSFLTNELVPIQLVVQSRKITSSIDEEFSKGPVRSDGYAPSAGYSSGFDDDDIPF